MVKLEKEIELEETLLMTEEPPPAVKTFSVCCQHGALYQPEVGAPVDTKAARDAHLEAAVTQPAPRRVQTRAEVPRVSLHTLTSEASS